ncbi:MAG TPA: Rieske (2Fe-2S) protein [Thermoflexales bacterium]|nr:Rieske (2Fe-2S) protein [Thermoflexales bacterium]HRA01537.1 Rieske (2Fe-2S) protein [Thermoflexales bacterium]
MNSYQSVLPLAQLAVNKPFLAQMTNARALLVRQSDDRVVAFSPLCPHQLGNLADGACRADEIECPVHGYLFSLHTGASVYPRGEYHLRFFDVKIEDGQVFVHIPRPKWMD